MRDNMLANLLVLGLAVIVAAFVLGNQIASIRTADRTVEVKGSAEMPVVADLATWSLNVSASGDDLPKVQAELNNDIDRIRSFLTGFGIAAGDIENNSLSVNDADANPYSQSHGPRFSVNGGVTVRTSNLDAIAKAKNNLAQLVGAGVVLTNSYGPNYAFTRLNDVKLELTSNATHEAFKAAQQFAKDSGAKVGGIRRARQGSVQILGRDSFKGEQEQVNKVLRVVTTVDYDLR